jgi:hypothetical protein
MYVLKHKAGRNCIRCSKDLTDAVSLNEGVGPICRKLDNKLLAHQIAANIDVARTAVLKVDTDTLAAESVATYTKVVESLYSFDAYAVSDWRTTVKRIEWTLSFPQNARGTTMLALIETAAALGYIGLAALWAGEASTGEATFAFLHNRIHVYGPRNKPFRIAVRKLGGVFHAGGANATASWSVPAKFANEFKPLIQKFYPNHDTQQLSAVIEVAKEAVLAAAPVVSAAPTVSHGFQPLKVPNMGNVRIEPSGDWFNVYTPYNQNFVSDLKMLPVGTRKWNPALKCWEVHASHAANLNDILGRYFKNAPNAVVETTDFPVSFSSDDDVMPF